VEERVPPLLRSAALVGGELEDVHGVERPAVRRGDLGELRAALGERHVQPARPDRRPGEQELQRQGGLAAAGLAVEQVQVVGRQAAVEDLVEPGDPGAHARGGAHGGGTRAGVQWRLRRTHANPGTG
jgi:hypothetical protein